MGLAKQLTDAHDRLIASFPLRVPPPQPLDPLEHPALALLQRGVSCVEVRLEVKRSFRRRLEHRQPVNSIPLCLSFASKTNGDGGGEPSRKRRRA